MHHQSPVDRSPPGAYANASPSASRKQPRETQETDGYPHSASHHSPPWKAVPFFSHYLPDCGRPNACCTSPYHPCRSLCSTSTTNGCNPNVYASRTYDPRHNRLDGDTSLDCHSLGPYLVHGHGRDPSPIIVAVVTITLSFAVPSVLAVFVFVFFVLRGLGLVVDMPSSEASFS